MCGAKGEIMRTSASTASFRTATVAARSTTPTDADVARAAARYAGIRSSRRTRRARSPAPSMPRSRCSGEHEDRDRTVTRRIVSCVFRRSARSASFSSSSAGARNPFAANRLGQRIDHAPHAREKPPAALQTASVHSISFSGGATNMTYSRSASAPNFWIMSSGSTTLPFDFDITWPFFSTMPCVSRRVNGSLMRRHAEIAEDAREEPRVDQVQDRVLDAAAVEVDRPPVADLLRIERQLGRSFGSQNRKKYHDESTNVSIVSVSRRAGPSQFGHVVLTNSGICASGESPRPLNSATFGSSTGSVVVGNRHHAALLAIHDRDGRAPVPLTRDAPVLQPILHRPFADAASLGIGRHLHVRFFPIEPVVFARVDEDPGAVVRRVADARVCGLGDSPSRGASVPRSTTVVIGRPYFFANSKSR